MINFEKTQLKKIKNPIENTIEKDQKCRTQVTSEKGTIENSRCATSFCCRCSRVHKGSRKSTQKVQSHGSGRPTQLSRPSWFPLSRGYCFSLCANQKRYQRTDARSCAQEVGESLRRVFGCHFVSAFRKKKPAKENNRFIFFIQIYRNLFHPVSQLKSRQPTNVYQEKNVIF